MAFSFILIISVAAFILYSNTGMIQVKAANQSMKAFYIAEAGLEVAIQKMADDFEYTPKGQAPSWADANLYHATGVYDLSQGGSIVVGKIYPNFYPLNNKIAYQGGTYTVDVANEAGRSNVVWLKSRGEYQDEDRTILVRLRIRDVSPWNNAIFAGTGDSGKVINGNVDIRGSVHILGISLGSADLAMEMGGFGGIGNNYKGMPASLFSRVPSILKPYGGNMVEDLETEVRIKHGKLALSGTALAGTPDSVGYKGTLVGAYITDGYGGNKGAANVYSDNGTDNSYDLGDKIPFPRISEAYEGYTTYENYIRANALIIDNPADLAILADITPGTVFSASNKKGELTLDGNGNLHATGIVLIDGPLKFSGKNTEKIEYTGKASIMATDDITITVDILTKWNNTYPYDDLLGFMTSKTVTFDKAQLQVMGLFYAEDQIVSNKQTSVTGTFFSNYFDMGSNVPSIYQVPETVHYLPPGMIGGDRYWTLKKEVWREI